jgi:beta-mannanase
MWSVWSQWGNGETREFPTQTLNQLANRDPSIVPVVWWEPWDPSVGFSQQFKWARYERILAGRHDAYIERWAKDARDYGGRVILRFAHEANGHWFPWGIGNFDNTTANYKKAWRHVRKIFRQVGATNVEFLWSVTKQECKGCNAFAKVYPGDRWVDWAGITAFNWGAQKTWRSMTGVLRRPLGELRAVTKKKVIVSELASNFKNGDKAAWITTGYPAVYDRWAFVRGVVYLDAIGPHVQFGHPDWRLVKPDSGTALDAYAAIAAMGRFKGPPSGP